MELDFLKDNLHWLVLAGLGCLVVWQLFLKKPQAPEGVSVSPVSPEKQEVIIREVAPSSGPSLDDRIVAAADGFRQLSEERQKLRASYAAFDAFENHSLDAEAVRLKALQDRAAAAAVTASTATAKTP